VAGGGIEGKLTSFGLFGGGRRITDVENSTDTQFLFFGNLSIAPVGRKSEGLDSTSLFIGYSFMRWGFHDAVASGKSSFMISNIGDNLLTGRCGFSQFVEIVSRYSTVLILVSMKWPGAIFSF